MEVKTIVKEIQRLPLSKRFFVLEQVVKSIKKEELKQTNWDDDHADFLHAVSETSLAKEWLSEEDNRWDEVL
ncbi:MAG: hypothetical protein KF900_04365 [Bacteroidetes bacterium]|nr:hypothetical protein [Bacteroidota bacterium]